MRKTSYVITFFAVGCVLILNVVSYTRSDWLVIQHSTELCTNIVTYGLAQRCETRVTRTPGPNNGTLEYTHFECRAFPEKVADKCEDERAGFCTAWVSARYLVELAVWCAVASLSAIVFGVSTHSRRRRIWRVVSGLVLLHASFQIAAFSIIVEMYRTSRYPNFEHARLGPGCILNVMSWSLGIVVASAVITTGLAADKGRRWAAGNRAYQPISSA